MPRKTILMENLPMDISLFDELFEYLEKKLSHSQCKNNFVISFEFLAKKNFDLNQIFEIITWFKNHHGYCDCEILYNIPDQIYD